MLSAAEQNPLALKYAFTALRASETIKQAVAEQQKRSSRAMKQSASTFKSPSAFIAEKHTALIQTVVYKPVHVGSTNPMFEPPAGVDLKRGLNHMYTPGRSQGTLRSRYAMGLPKAPADWRAWGVEFKAEEFK